MFSFSRYLPIGRGTPETPEGVEMTAVRQDSPHYASPRFEDPSPSNDSFEELYEEAPSGGAVVAVRLCVWAFFLFGFLILFQNQQEKFNAERSRQTGRLRAPQLIHMQLPWTDFSGFQTHSTNFVAHLIESNSTTLSVLKLNSGALSLTCRRLGFEPLQIDQSNSSVPIDIPPGPLDALQALSNGQVVPVAQTDGGRFGFSYQGTWFLFGDAENFHLAFFQLLVSDSSLVAVMRSKLDPNTDDCLATYTLTNGTAKCTGSTPIFPANAYFFDEAFGNLVSVGTDDFTVDGAGYSMHGIFIQSLHLKKEGGGSALEFSISIPFIHRYSDGIWTFQNAPLTQGFVVLVPPIGFPAQPVQHLVSVRPGTAEYPKGSVFRLESAELSLFRKIETLKFSPPNSGKTCHCS